MNELTIIDEDNIKDKIFNIRGLSVMLDKDLAELYNIETKTFNQSIRRNIKRFPEDFLKESASTRDFSLMMMKKMNW